ncbi:MAG: DUF3800 domain-containing protein, partial [bacterium]
MSYLYLDESGNLGYQLQTSGVSRHFVITILEVPNEQAKKAIEKAIVRTMRHKVHGKSTLQRNLVTEIKGAKTSFAAKQYFYRFVADIPFNLYTVILDKKRFINHLQFNQSRVYNFITYRVLKMMPLEQATNYIMLIVDRSKSKVEIREFNAYLFNQLEAQIPPQVPLIINHNYSHENKPLQAVDLFAWGILRKYETGDTKWYEIFREKIVYEQMYPF